MAADPATGRVIGSYKLLEPVGEGGMSAVYRAEHAAIQKEVAIKLLRPDLSLHPEMVDRFFHEAKSVNRVRHENLIDILDFGETPRREHYIVMELLKGELLKDALAHGPLAVERVGKIGVQIANALAAAHEKGIIHRDLKAANVFLTTRAGQRDFVKILDFGIAKILSEEEGSRRPKTQVGAMVGTPLCMSPEQAQGGAVDLRTDVYALGVLLYQMAVGEPPFYDENAVLLALKHVDEPPPRPREKNPEIPEALSAVILRCLEKSPDARFSTMGELAQALAAATALPEAAAGSERPAPRRGPGPSQESTIPPVPVSEKPPRRPAWAFWAIPAALGLLLLSGVALFSPPGLGASAQPEGPGGAPASAPASAPSAAAPSSQGGAAAPASSAAAPDRPASAAAKDAAKHGGRRGAREPGKTARPEEKAAAKPPDQREIGRGTADAFAPK